MLALSYKSMLEEIFDDSRWAVDRNDPPTRPLGVHWLHGQQQQGRSEDGDVPFKLFQVMTQGKIDLRNESGRPMKVKVVREVSEKRN